MVDKAVLEACARAAHEVNRAYCAGLGDHTQPPWEQAPKWQQESALAGARVALECDIGPQESHERWASLKTEEGWTYGAVKDPEAKTHPCLVPYKDLPAEQRAKDFLFLSTVRAMRNALVSPDRLYVPRIPTGVLNDLIHKCYSAQGPTGPDAEPPERLLKQRAYQKLASDYLFSLVMELLDCRNGVRANTGPTG